MITKWKSAPSMGCDRSAHHHSREFPDYRQAITSLPERQRGVAMSALAGYVAKKPRHTCCSKVSRGVHLQGGILKYLESVPAEESLWEGECFVFDQRVGVRARPGAGQYELCYVLRAPDQCCRQSLVQISGWRFLSDCYDILAPENEVPLWSGKSKSRWPLERGERHIGTRRKKSTKPK